jgi:hypothetical protein
MGSTDLRETTTTDLNSGAGEFSVKSAKIDEASVSETFWDSRNFSEYLGYYKSIPELKKAIDALAMWSCGKGFKTDQKTRNNLKLIQGWGEDSFQSVMKNMLVIKKINGDSFAEIIRDEKGNLINLKPLNPLNVRTIVNKKGIIIRYEEISQENKEAKRTLSPKKVLHLVNDRIGNEIHGTSVVEACKWVIDARNEAMTDWRRILHRSSVRVLEVDADDAETQRKLKQQWKEAIKNGEVIILPVQEKGGLKDYTAPPIEPFLRWIQYLENFFYQAVGIPKIILGGSQEYTEASSKVGYLTFEQVYMTEQRELEEDLFNQLGIELEFERPVSLKEQVLESEAANTGQVGFQQNELNASLSRDE